MHEWRAMWWWLFPLLGVELLFAIPKGQAKYIVSNMSYTYLRIWLLCIAYFKTLFQIAYKIICCFLVSSIGKLIIYELFELSPLQSLKIVIEYVVQAYSGKNGNLFISEVQDILARSWVGPWSCSSPFSKVSHKKPDLLLSRVPSNMISHWQVFLS